jgi:hypothetical protein
MTKPLFDVFRESMLHNPDGSRKEAQDHFIAAMKSDPAYLEMLALDYFERMAAYHVVRKDTLGHSFVRTEVSQDRNERIRDSLVNRSAPPPGAPSASSVETIETARRKREESAARTAEAFAELKAKVRNIILLDLELPNGKKLRNATGAECKKAGGFYAEIAKHLKPSQVVDRHMSEADLQSIRARFFQTNVA